MDENIRSPKTFSSANHSIPSACTLVPGENLTIHRNSKPKFYQNVNIFTTTRGLLTIPYSRPQDATQVGNEKYQHHNSYRGEEIFCIDP